jgi:hypothetical protein
MREGNYAVFAADIPLNAVWRRDLYRLPVFSLRMPLLMARSIAESVGRSRFPAAVPSPAVSAVRMRFIIVRTRVRLARLTAARSIDCLARLSTDFLRFLTLVGVP